jgi:hypothetical protein
LSTGTGPLERQDIVAMQQARRPWQPRASWRTAGDGLTRTSKTRGMALFSRPSNRPRRGTRPAGFPLLPCQILGIGQLLQHDQKPVCVPALNMVSVSVSRSPSKFLPTPLGN